MELLELTQKEGNKRSCFRVLFQSVKIQKQIAWYYVDRHYTVSSQEDIHMH
jgi:hypothetical protein